ncbi:uncharacterized protein LOC134230748 [Saccostrea cucullata]|uniref:uncharacterized protein LOC134230748 n=1 Tax=Saccostrea cuccullata TaxID=36930 RepID=UPI002ECFE146
MDNEWRLCLEKTDSLMSITNEGLASEQVQNWTVQAIQAQNSNTKRKQTSNFYSSSFRKKSQVAVKESRVVSFVPGYRLILHRHHTKHTVPAQQSGVHTNTEQDTCMDSLIDLYKVKDGPR